MDVNVVIVGGNERMICQYKQICKNYNCKAKVFVDMPGNFRGQIGRPDLLVLFTSTVSHKMASCALQEAAKNRTAVARSHSSSTCALKNILETHCISA